MQLWRRCRMQSWTGWQISSSIRLEDLLLVGDLRLCFRLFMGRVPTASIDPLSDGPTSPRSSLLTRTCADFGSCASTIEV
jgi:hypothetical protein